jgi:hypothetical protein
VEGGEALAVEVANEVLDGGAAEGAAGVEADDEDPVVVEGEEVGALPDAGGGAGGAEVREGLPVEEVG